MTAADQCWSMDFVADNLFNGRRIRALTVVDNFSRECLALILGGDHTVNLPILHNGSYRNLFLEQES